MARVVVRRGVGRDKSRPYDDNQPYLPMVNRQYITHFPMRDRCACLRRGAIYRAQLCPTDPPAIHHQPRLYICAPPLHLPFPTNRACLSPPHRSTCHSPPTVPVYLCPTDPPAIHHQPRLSICASPIHLPFTANRAYISA